MQAVAVTFVKFFLEPAGHIGEALNRLVIAAFDDLPFYLWLPVFILIVFLIVLLMFCMFGYRVGVGGWLLNIEPHRPVEPLRERIHQLEQAKQEMLRENGELRKQLQQEKPACLDELRVRFCQYVKNKHYKQLQMDLYDGIMPYTEVDDQYDKLAINCCRYCQLS